MGIEYEIKIIKTPQDNRYKGCWPSITEVIEWEEK